MCLIKHEAMRMFEYMRVWPHIIYPNAEWWCMVNLMPYLLHPKEKNP
jgi:hypothetical protein